MNKVVTPRCKFKLANLEILIEMGANKNLRSNCYMVYMAILMFHNDDTNDCFPSLESIANVVGINKRNVSIAINKLVEEGFLIVNSGKQGISNNYYFPKEVYFKKNSKGEMCEVPYEVLETSQKRNKGFQPSKDANKPEKENIDNAPF